MKVHSEWDDSGQGIVRTVHERDWTWDELHEHNETELADMLGATGGPFRLIADMIDSPYFNPGSFMEQVRRASATYEALGVQVIVFVIHEDDIGTLLVSAYRRFLPDGVFITARGLDEARDIIARTAYP